MIASIQHMRIGRYMLHYEDVDLAVEVCCQNGSTFNPQSNPHLYILWWSLKLSRRSNARSVAAWQSPILIIQIPGGSSCLALLKRIRTHDRRAATVLAIHELFSTWEDLTDTVGYYLSFNYELSFVVNMCLSTFNCVKSIFIPFLQFHIS